MSKRPKENVPRKGASVCMVSFYYEPNYSGSAIQAGNLCRFLQRRGLKTFVVSAMLDSTRRRETLNGIEVFRVPVIRWKPLQVPSFWLSLAWFLFRQRNAYDIVHAHGTLQHGPASILGLLLGKPSILKVAMHRSDIAFRKQGRIWGRIIRFYVRRFSRYIATSRQIFEEFREEGLDGGRVLRIPNGVDTERFRPAGGDLEKETIKNRLGLPSEPVILFSGILLPRKNIHFLIEVFHGIRKRTSRGHLAIVGPGTGPGGSLEGGYFRRLTALIEEKGLQDHVTFTGRRDDMAEFFRGADVYMFAPLREGMPNVLLEAMASGLPCVVSRISGIEDVIDNGANGFIYALEDRKGFEEAGVRLLSDEELRTVTGRRARDHILSRYSLDVIADRYVELYDSLLRGGRGTSRQ